MSTLNLTSIDELPFDSLNKYIIACLKKFAIVNFGQLVELIENRPEFIIKFKLNRNKIRQECRRFCQKHGQDGFSFSKMPIIVPPMGMILDPSRSDVIMQRRDNAKQQRLELAELANKLEPQLPDECLLADKMQAVRDQGNLGSCTGFGSINSREFLVKKQLSPGFAYRGAKMIDGHSDLEGSWQEFAFEFMYRYGAMKENDYTYQQCLDDECIKPYLGKSSKYKIQSYVDLMVEPEHLPMVLKAALTGYLAPELGPQPVAVSLVLYQSFCDWSAYTTGLIPMPFESEKKIGGHAMSVCGYITLYGLNYFVLINSWGESFAKDNPLGLPGYALVPENYMAKPGLVGELILPVDT